ELRVVSHDSDYARVLPRSGAGLSGPSGASSPSGSSGAPASTGAASTATAAAPAAVATPAAPLDQRGTRRAPRFRVTPALDIVVDGNTATLIDLSSVG